MKRYILAVPIGLICFCASLYLAQENNFIPAAFPHAGVALYYRLGGHPLSGDVEVQFIGMKATEYGKYAEFRVTNGLTREAFYWGYGKNSHCDQQVRSGGMVARASNCWCGTGLAEQSLKPGEAATFQVEVLEGVTEFAAGFNFLIGRNQTPETAWSKPVKVPAS